jgi:hypothetical protein
MWWKCVETNLHQILIPTFAAVVEKQKSVWCTSLDEPYTLCVWLMAPCTQFNNKSRIFFLPVKECMIERLQTSVNTCKRAWKPVAIGNCNTIWTSGLDDRVSIPGKGNRIFYTPQRPDRLWSLSLGTEGLVPGRQCGKTLHPMIHLHPVLRLRAVELYLYSPKHLHGILRNY